jgi:hypothetical protein
MKSLSSLFLALFAAGVLTVVVSAQAPPVPPVAAPPAPGPNPQPFVQAFGAANTWHMIMQSQSRATELAQQLAKAENEDEKGKIREKLTEVLNQIFDEHMQQQQKEMDELEKQIANLRTLMRKRSAAKNEIVERRIEQMIDDAKGLGWSTPGSPHFNLQHSFPFTNMTGTPAVPGTPKEATSKEAGRKKKTEASRSKDRKKSEDEDDDEKGKDKKKTDDDNDND